MLICSLCIKALFTVKYVFTLWLSQVICLLVTRCVVMQHRCKKTYNYFHQAKHFEGFEFNCSEVLNLLEICVFVSVRRNSGLSGAKLFCLKLHLL